jgi:hypothetical protein
MKPVRIARNRLKDKKWTKVIYQTYVLTFPDGDQWVKQQPMSAHDMAFELNKMIAEHRAGRLGREWKLRAEALWRAGECWWKDEAGVEHLILIEEKTTAKI